MTSQNADSPGALISAEGSQSDSVENLFPLEPAFSELPVFDELPIQDTSQPVIQTEGANSKGANLKDANPEDTIQ